jgi:hypothetical protein
MADATKMHLRRLEEKNRARALEEAARLGAEERRTRARERGFSTHFSGANQLGGETPALQPTAPVRRRSRAAAENAAGDANVVERGGRGRQGAACAPVRARKTWGAAVDPLVAAAGAEAFHVEAKAEGDEGELDYDDDFETCSDSGGAETVPEEFEGAQGEPASSRLEREHASATASPLAASRRLSFVDLERGSPGQARTALAASAGRAGQAGCVAIGVSGSGKRERRASRRLSVSHNAEEAAELLPAPGVQSATAKLARLSAKAPARTALKVVEGAAAQPGTQVGRAPRPQPSAFDPSAAVRTRTSPIFAKGGKTLQLGLVSPQPQPQQPPPPQQPRELLLPCISSSLLSSLSSGPGSAAESFASFHSALREEEGLPVPAPVPDPDPVPVPAAATAAAPRGSLVPSALPPPLALARASRFRVETLSSPYSASTASPGAEEQFPATASATTGPGSARGCRGESGRERRERALAGGELPRGRHLRINLTESWGDQYYFGLTGLAVLVRDAAAANGLREVYLPMSRVKARPSDINVNGHHGDPRTLDKLVNRVNETTAVDNMWLVEFNAGEDHVVELDLGSADFELAGLRVWNYNKNAEDSARGVKTAHISLDGQALTPPQGATLRRALGLAGVDYSQTLLFSATDAQQQQQQQQQPSARSLGSLTLPSSSSAGSPSCDPATTPMCPVEQDWLTPVLPCGQLLRIDLHGTHGDAAWVGLDRIELLDAMGDLIVLDGPHPQGRVLVHSGKSDADLLHSKPWLERLSECNSIFIVFDEPVAISVVKLWNYAKSPRRGVKELSLFLDSMIIFSGQLGLAAPAGHRQVPHCVLFCPDADLETGSVRFCGEQEQVVEFFNNCAKVERCE